MDNELQKIIAIDTDNGGKSQMNSATPPETLSVTWNTALYEIVTLSQGELYLSLKRQEEEHSHIPEDPSKKVEGYDPKFIRTEVVLLMGYCKYCGAEVNSSHKLDGDAHYECPECGLLSLGEELKMSDPKKPLEKKVKEDELIGYCKCGTEVRLSDRIEYDLYKCPTCDFAIWRGDLKKPKKKRKKSEIITADDL